MSLKTHLLFLCFIVTTCLNPALRASQGDESSEEFSFHAFPLPPEDNPPTPDAPANNEPLETSITIDDGNNLSSPPPSAMTLEQDQPTLSLFQTVISIISPDLNSQEMQDLGQQYYEEKIRHNIFQRKACSLLSSLCNYTGYLAQSVGSFLPILKGFQGVSSPSYNFSSNIISFLGAFIKPGETHFELLAQNAKDEIELARKMLGINVESYIDPSHSAPLPLSYFSQKNPQNHNNMDPKQREIIRVLHQDNLHLYHSAVFKERLYNALSALCNYTSYTALGLSSLLPNLEGFDFIDSSDFPISAATLFFVGVIIKPGQSYFDHLSKLNRHTAEEAHTKARRFTQNAASTSSRDDLDNTNE